MNLEYYIASLPMLIFGKKPAGITAERLAAECGGAVAAIFDDSAPTQSSFVLELRKRERELRAEIAAARKKKEKVGGMNPLEREIATEKRRWMIAEELGGVEPLSERALLAYAARLRIAERMAKWDDEIGAEKLQAAIEVAEKLNK